MSYPYTLTDIQNAFNHEQGCLPGLSLVYTRAEMAQLSQPAQAGFALSSRGFNRQAHPLP